MGSEKENNKEQRKERKEVLDKIYERGKNVYAIIYSTGQDPSMFDLLCFAMVVLIAASSTMQIIRGSVKQIIGTLVDGEIELKKTKFDENGILSIKGE